MATEEIVGEDPLNASVTAQFRSDLIVGAIHSMLMRPSPFFRLLQQGDTSDELWLAQCKAAEGWPLPAYELRACVSRILHANDHDVQTYNKNGFRHPHELELGSGLWSAAPMYEIIENEL